MYIGIGKFVTEYIVTGGNLVILTNTVDILEISTFDNIHIDK